MTWSRWMQAFQMQRSKGVFRTFRLRTLAPHISQRTAALQRPHPTQRLWKQSCTTLILEIPCRCKKRRTARMAMGRRPR